VKKNYEFVIIGQGIAGTVLSWYLIEKNLNFLIINDPKKASSSSAALGVYNPITGKRFVETWKAKELINKTEKFYKKIENKLKTKILYKKNIYRPFHNNKNINDWQMKLESRTFKKYIKKLDIKSRYNLMNDDLGGIITKKSGYIDVTKFIKLSKKYLKSNNHYKEIKIHPNDIVIKKKFIEFDKIKTRNLIFCIGSDQNTNRFFSWLPFNLVKGETIDIEMKIRLKEIIQKSILIIPTNKNLYKIGSTYEWNDFENKNTIKGINELKNKISAILDSKYNIINKKFGIRPASKDRRAFVGFHPQYKNIGIINGLGSKGVSLAPYCAENLLENILKNKLIDNEINIKRYISLYS